MRYGKVVNGEFIEAPSVVRFGGRVLYNPSKSKLFELGYLEEVTTSCPSKEYVSRYEVHGDKAVQVWIKKPMDIEEEYNSLCELLISERYSHADENKIVREYLANMDDEEKRNQFFEYNSYVEECKIRARKETYG
jgi:hypothetical protein